jgi:DNA-binding transcriptional MerR regulator
MNYTIKQLAELSGVSTRTLRYYDEIDLLSPAFYAANGYRYYQEEQLLMLQQILFFRSFGIKLEAIHEIIKKDDFDKLKALYQHRRFLIEHIDEKQQLLQTIDKTILHLKGEINMTEQEMYLAFKHPKQIEMADYIVANMGDEGAKLIEKSKEAVKQLTIKDLERLEKENAFMAKVLKMMLEQGIKPDSEFAQDFIKYHDETRVKPFADISDDAYIKLTELDIAHPESRKRFDDLHPDCADFFLQAVKIFVKNRQKSA